MFSYMFSNTNINGYFSCVFVVFLFKKGMKAIREKKVHVLSLIWTTRQKRLQRGTSVHVHGGRLFVPPVFSFSVGNL